MDLKSVIKKPLISEKTMRLGNLNRYVFLVDERANKNQIKEAVRYFFKVDPVQVWTLKIAGEAKWALGRRRKTNISGFKKAIVALKEGQKLDFYETTEGKEEKQEKKLKPKKK